MGGWRREQKRARGGRRRGLEEGGGRGLEEGGEEG